MKAFRLIFGLLWLASQSPAVTPALWAQDAPATAAADEDADIPDEGIAIGSHVFGDLSARSIGPAVMSGRVAALDVVASDPRIIYVGAASGGVWKSKDGGIRFEAVFDDHIQGIGAVTIDQAHPNTVWVGTGEIWVRNSVSVGDGIYKTVDGGEKWERMGLDETERIGKILIDPRNPDVVYAATLGHLWDANEERGLFKTADGGQTWEKILYVNEDTGCTDLAMDPQEPDILYAAMWQFRRSPDFFTSGGPGSGLYKSTDAGQTWRKLTKGLPEGELGRIALTLAPSRPNVIYATVESEKTALYRSEDLGESWVKRTANPSVRGRPFYFSLLIPDPQDHNRLYKPSTGLHVSKDGGETFEGIGGWVHVDYHAMWINPHNPQNIVVGNDGGVYITYNRGSGWRHAANLPISQFYRVSVDMAEPYNVYGGLQDNGSWMGPSRSPGGIENADWENLGGGDGFCVLVDPADADFLYWEWQGGNVMRKTRSTGENKDIKPQAGPGEPEYRFNWNTPIHIGPNAPHRLYVGSQFLHRSTNRGDSWEKVSDDLTTNDPAKQRQKESGGLTVDNTTAENHCTIFTICESPLDAQVIWVGTDDGNLQVTSDDGQSWREVSGAADGVPAGTWVSCVEASHHDRTAAYVTFDGHRQGDKRTYVYKTTDLGGTWQPIMTEEIEGYAHVIREDLVNPDLLFVGTEFGLYLTLDDGRHWARFEENLPKVPVNDMVIHPRDSDLILGTHGRGIYIIDDITPLRQITSEVMQAEVFVLESEPAYHYVPQWKQHSPGDGYFVAGNPTRSAKITYYLKKRHMFGDMRVEIFDAEGNLLKTLAGGKRKGINRITWQPRLKPPKVAPSPVLDPSTSFAGQFGPIAPEGRYTFNITKGEETYDGAIDLRADPASPHSAEDRAIQQKTAMELYDMLGRLAYVAEAVAGARDDAQDRAEKLGEKDSLRRQLEEFAGELDALHQTLLVSEEIQGIPGDPRLREKVVRLYASVLGYMGRPSESQLKRMAVLNQEIEEAHNEFLKLTSGRIEDLNKKLQGKDLAPIELLTEEEFRKREDS